MEDTVLKALEEYRLNVTVEQKQADLNQLEKECKSEVVPADKKCGIQIIETPLNEPLYILNKERYDYYRNCEKKSRAVDVQIKDEAKVIFEEWKSKTAHEIVIKIKDPYYAAHKPYDDSVEVTWCDAPTWISDIDDPSFKFNCDMQRNIKMYAEDAFDAHTEYFKSCLKKAIKNRNGNLSFYRFLTFVFAFLSLFLGLAWLLEL